MSDSNQRNKPSCCSSFLHFIRTNALSKFLIQFAQKVKKEFTWEKGLRLFLIFVGGIFMIINTLIGIVIPSSEVDCLSDKTLDLTAPLNTFFKKHNILKIILTILSSLSIDGIIVYALITWGLFAKTSRYVLSLVSYFVLYLLIRELFQVRQPAEYIWEYPHFPSLFVSYKETSSLFYSNVLGLLMITLLEFKENKNTIPFFISVFLIIFESLFMLSLQGHYIIDIFTPIFLGHYLFILFNQFSSVFDKFFGMKDNKETQEEYDEIKDVKKDNLIPTV